MQTDCRASRNCPRNNVCLEAYQILLVNVVVRPKPAPAIKTSALSATTSSCKNSVWPMRGLHPRPSSDLLSSAGVARLGGGRFSGTWDAPASCHGPANDAVTSTLPFRSSDQGHLKSERGSCGVHNFGFVSFFRGKVTHHLNTTRNHKLKVGIKLE